MTEPARTRLHTAVTAVLTRHHGHVRIAELVLKYVQALAWPAVTLTVLWSLRAHMRAALDRVTRVETPVGAIEFAAAARDVLRQSESAPDGTVLPVPAQTPLPQPVITPQQPPPGSDAQAPPPAAGGSPHQPGNPPRQARPSPQTTPTPPGPTEYGYGYSQPVTDLRPTVDTPFGDGRLTHARRAQLREARDAVDAAPAGAVAMAWNALHALCTDKITAAGFPAPSLPVEFGARLASLGASPYSVTVLDRLHRLSADALHEPAAVTPSAARDYVDACLGTAREIERLGWLRGW